MYGAILGDIIGSPYEHDRGSKSKYFPLFVSKSRFTDDTAMTVAVADGLMRSRGKPDYVTAEILIKSMQHWGRRYPLAGYGSKFLRWLASPRPVPYGSLGNGAAMRVSSVGWLYDSLEETRHMAMVTAEVTHNHPEGVKGARAVACAIYLARTGSDKDAIKSYVTDEYGYDLSRTCDEIRPTYHHIESCQETVPQAVTAFLEGSDFEDVIRNAVSLGGDTDTVACIAGAIAEAFFGVPDDLKTECRKRLPKPMTDVLQRFEAEAQKS